MQGGFRDNSDHYEQLLRTALLPNYTAARCPLYASRYALRQSGQPSAQSGGTTLAFSPNRAEVCPVVGSNRRAALSGKREAA